MRSCLDHCDDPSTHFPLSSDGSVSAKVSAQIICASKADKDGDGHGDRHAAVEHAVIGATSCLFFPRLRGSDCRHLRFPQREAFYQGAGGCG